MSTALHEVAAHIVELLQGQVRRDVQSVAERYRDLCETVNARLRRCADFIRRGLISEAIHHAEIPPDLFDLVPSLDVEDFDGWDNYCAKYDLARAPRLLLDVAKQLNQSYVIEEARRPLLRQARLMALAGSPLRFRLKNLRSLLALDPNCTLWDADIKAFEQARIAEVTQELKRATHARSVECIKHLVDELTEPVWTIPIPEGLLAGLRAELQRAKADHALTELRRLSPALDKAYMAMDLDRCRSLLNQCESIIAQGGLTLPENQAKRIRPVQAWVMAQEQQRQQEQQFADACARLRAELENERSDATTHRRLYDMARSFGMKLDEELEQSYQSVQEALALRGKRLATRRAISLCAIVVTGIVVLVFVYFHAQGKAAIGAALAQLTRAVEQAKRDPAVLNDAIRAWESLEKEQPDYARAEEFAAVHEDLLRAQKLEDQRLAEWKRLDGEITQLLKQWADDPAPFLEADSVPWGQLTKAIERAQSEGIVVLESELLDRRKRIQEYQAMRQKREDAADERVARNVKGHRDKFKTLEAQFSKDLPKDKLDEMLKNVDAICQSLDKAVEADLRVSQRNQSEVTGAKQDVRALGEKVRGVRRGHVEAAREKSSLESVVAAASRGATDLAEALKKHADAYPDSNQSKDFARAEKSVDDWKAIEEWAKQCRDGWKYELRPRSATEAEVRLRKLEEFGKKFPQFVLFDKCREYEEYLKEIRPLLASEALLKCLQELRNNVLLKQEFDYYCLKGKSGEKRDNPVYYFVRRNEEPKPVSETPGKYRFPIYRLIDGRIVSPSSDGNKDGNKKVEVVMESDRPERGPQSELKNALLTLIKEAEANWPRPCETVLGELIVKIRSHEKVDPILRVQLIALISQRLQNEPWFHHSVLEPLALVEALPELSAWPDEPFFWLDPIDEEVQKARGQARARIASWPDFADRLAERKKHIQALLDSLNLRCLATCVLLKDVQGKWRLDPPSSTVTGKSAEACAIVRPTSGPPRWVVVARSDSAFKVSDAVVAQLPEGTMVFVCEKPDRKAAGGSSTSGTKKRP